MGKKHPQKKYQKIKVTKKPYIRYNKTTKPKNKQIIFKKLYEKKED